MAQNDADGIRRLEVTAIWNPQATFVLVRSHGLPIQAVKQGGCGKLVLVFSKPITPMAVDMIYRDVNPMPTGNKQDLSNQPSKTPKNIKYTKKNKPPCIRRRIR